MEYLITPPEDTDWKINLSDFAKNLLNQWPDVEIRQVTDSDDFYVLEWSIKVSGLGQRLDGALHRDGQGISLDGYLEDCARFALWFRSLVLSRQKLIFYDQGYNYNLALQQETTESEIMAAFCSPNLDRALSMT